MTISEACQLVLEAGSMGKGGEIYVFDMGKPVKIVDLAKKMIARSGRKEVQIRFTGLRPGEKLYEELLNVEEYTKPTHHEKIMIADVRVYEYEVVKEEIEELIRISYEYDDRKTVRKMKEIVPEFHSLNSPYASLDKTSPALSDLDDTEPAENVAHPDKDDIFLLNNPNQPNNPHHPGHFGHSGDSYSANP
jgi:FlaA1/EpsC-like NDP-sugar epimerase